MGVRPTYFEALEPRLLLSAGVALPDPSVELAGASIVVEAATASDARDLELWADTLAGYLSDPLWIDRDAYDAGHHLMVPLHAAFELGETGWQDQFAEHFTAFLGQTDDLCGVPLSRLQYLYVGTRFLVLAQAAGRADIVPAGLDTFIYTELKTYWNETPASSWGMTFEGGIQEQIEWKLTTAHPYRSYYRAVQDTELFLLSMAADLSQYDRLGGGGFGAAERSTLSEMLDTAYQVFDQEVAWQAGGGWLFQPGVWSEHPDTSYAGQTEEEPGLLPAPLEGIASDSSHSHRMSLWLRSLRGACEPGGERAAFYDRLEEGLARQFFGAIYVAPDGAAAYPRTTNYMDGGNGVYRWQYATMIGEDGYGPYELSGTLLMGWWAFLGTSESQALYSELATSFPLSAEAIDCYYTPGTRGRHPLVSQPDKFSNGLSELICRLGAKLSAEPQSPAVVGASEAVSVPVITAPAERTWTDRPQFVWTAVDGSTGYQLVVEDVTAGSGVVIDVWLAVDGVPGEAEVVTWTSPAALTAWHVYSVCVRSDNAGQLGGWSDELDFLVAPGLPILETPVESNGGGQLTWRWSAVDGAGQYRLRVNDVTSGVNGVVDTVLTAGDWTDAGRRLEWTASNTLAEGHAYKGFMWPYAGGKYAYWSTPREFTAGLGPIEFDARSEVRSTDADGDVVTVWMTGAGEGTVTFDSGEPTGIRRIELSGTDIASSLYVEVGGPGGGLTTVEALVVEGTVGSIVAPAVDLAGWVEVSGGLSRLELHDVADQHTIVIGPAANDGATVTVRMARVADLSITSLTPIWSLAVDEWLDTDGTPDVVRAPSIRRLRVEGDFQADIELDGSDAAETTLYRAEVDGAVDGDWTVTGAVRSVRVGEWVSGGITAVAAAVPAAPPSLSAPMVTGDFGADAVPTGAGGPFETDITGALGGVTRSVSVAAHRVGVGVWAAVDPGLDGSYVLVNDPGPGRVPSAVVIGEYEGAGEQLFGVIEAAIGRVRLGGTTLLLEAGPFAEGAVCVEDLSA